MSIWFLNEFLISKIKYVSNQKGNKRIKTSNYSSDTPRTPQMQPLFQCWRKHACTCLVVGGLSRKLSKKIVISAEQPFVRRPSKHNVICRIREFRYYIYFVGNLLRLNLFFCIRPYACQCKSLATRLSGTGKLAILSVCFLI